MGRQASSNRLLVNKLSRFIGRNRDHDDGDSSNSNDNRIIDPQSSSKAPRACYFLFSCFSISKTVH